MAAKKRIMVVGYLSCLLIILPIFLVSSDGIAGNEELYGTWRLVTNQRKLMDTGEISDMMGKEPQGFINYGPDGRVFVIITAENRPKPAVIEKMTDQERIDLFKTMLAYSGKYKYDGKTVTHQIEISWNGAWTGTSQVRNVKLDGRRLTLTSNPAPNAIDGKMSIAILTWEKMD
jgi:hypothetical protein